MLWRAFQEWTDERLTWQPNRFGNLTDVILKADKIWLPELAIMNGLVSSNCIQMANLR